MAKRLSLDLPRFLTRLSEVREQVCAAAAASPDGAASPELVVVTKYLQAHDTQQLRDAGVGPLGENRAQELEEKVDPGADREGWHFIGHLQRNKIGKILPRVSLVHSVDSRRLAGAIDRWIEEYGRGPLRYLVQINISGEQSKGGLSPSDALRELPQWVEQFRELELAGLMTMAPAIPAEQCRSVFRNLRQLRDELRQELPESAADSCVELSMGMSNDYLVAAEEGATLLRIGQVLYR